MLKLLAIANRFQAAIAFFATLLRESFVEVVIFFNPTIPDC
ncbi:hypothetical protein [Chroococcidiopsis cubana]|nr:hypothetical protein [Chroococcidiopsis cubana]